MALGDLFKKESGVWTKVANIRGPRGGGNVGDLSFVLDGGGAALTTGIKGYLVVDFDCTITQWTLLADLVGSLVLGVWACSYGDFDAGATHPVVGDAITGAAPPTIAAASKGQGDATGWSATIAAGTILAISVTSVTSITRATLSLKVTKV